MRPKATALALLCQTGSLVLADSTAYCPKHNNQVVKVDNTAYTIGCDVSFMTPSPKNVRINSTPDMCARHCTQDASCSGIVWYEGICWQVNSEPSASILASGAIAFTPGAKYPPDDQPDPPQNPPPTFEPSLCQGLVDSAVANCKSLCAAEKQASQLICNTEKQIAEKQCTQDKEALEEQVKECKPKDGPPSAGDTLPTSATWYELCANVKSDSKLK